VKFKENTNSSVQRPVAKKSTGGKRGGGGEGGTKQMYKHKQENTHLLYIIKYL
jgi:hypothetical protein